MKTSLLLFAMAFFTACGSADDDAVDEAVDDSPPVSPTCTKRNVNWLRENNLWRVAWSDVERSSRRADTGTYDMRLGKPYTSGDYTLYPLLISGDARRGVPRYQAIGATMCGDIVGLSGKELVPIYEARTQRWTGNGFWGQVAASKGQLVDTTLASAIMDRSTFLKPPFIAIGTVTTESTPATAGGCTFYYEVGQTICTEGTAATSTSTATMEYWSDAMGPVVFHDSTSYGSLRAHETRVEVYYFGSNAEADLQNNLGGNAIAEAIPLELTSELAAQVVVLPAGSAANVTPSGPGIPPEAVGIENWFSLDVTPALASKSLLVFLAWTNDASYELLVFTAPDSDHGFQYVTRGDIVSAAEIEAAGLDISGAVNCSGQYVAAKYLIGIRRLKHGTGDDGYSLFTQAE